MSRKLRIHHILVQPVLIWDDGDEIEDGPQVPPMKVGKSKMAQFMESLDGDVADLQARLEAQEEEQPSDQEEPPAEG